MEPAYVSLGLSCALYGRASSPPPPPAVHHHKFVLAVCFPFQRWTWRAEGGGGWLGIT